MNIAFLLTPKRDVVWLPAKASLAEALELLRPHRYSAVPVIDEAGGYVGALTEGDILWRLLRADSGWRELATKVPVRLVPRRTRITAVHIDADIDALITRAIHQNFVPVVDDREVFIGIVRRQHIIEYSAGRPRGSGDALHATAADEEPILMGDPPRNAQ